MHKTKPFFICSSGKHHLSETFNLARDAINRGVGPVAFDNTADINAISFRFRTDNADGRAKSTVNSPLKSDADAFLKCLGC